MKKAIVEYKVESCILCPHHGVKVWFTGCFMGCCHPDIDRKEWNDEDFPEWCPLEDTELKDDK